MKVIVYANKQMFIHYNVEAIENCLPGAVVVWKYNGDSYKYDKVTKIKSEVI